MGSTVATSPPQCPLRPPGVSLHSVLLVWVIRLPTQLTMQLPLAAPIAPGHQLHGQLKLDAGQRGPGRLPLDAQRAEIVESAALLVVGGQVQQGVAVAGDRNLQEVKVPHPGQAQNRAQLLLIARGTLDLAGCLQGSPGLVMRWAKSLIMLPSRQDAS